MMICSLPFDSTRVTAAGAYKSYKRRKEKNLSPDEGRGGGLLCRCVMDLLQIGLDIASPCEGL